MALALTEHRTLTPLALCAVFVALATAVATRLPYTTSLLAVALLAGPHNWMELRYFVTHMPARWGPGADWFRIALGGTCVLALGSVAIQWIAVQLDDDFYPTANTAWTIALVTWIALLVHLRNRTRTRPLLIPTTVVACAVIIICPLPWDLVLVFTHPLIALAFLDRDLRTHPHLRRWLRMFFAALPVICIAVYFCALDAPMPNGALQSRVQALAGGEIFNHVSPERLVALYVFLQLLHYGAWLIALPLLRLREAPWSLEKVPSYRRFKNPLRVGATLGLAAVAALWFGFAVSPAATWDIYFQLAVIHVLAEFPFLVRKLVS